MHHEGGFAFLKELVLEGLHRIHDNVVTQRELKMSDARRTQDFAIAAIEMTCGTALIPHP